MDVDMSKILVSMTTEESLCTSNTEKCKTREDKYNTTRELTTREKGFCNYISSFDIVVHIVEHDDNLK